MRFGYTCVLLACCLGRVCGSVALPQNTFVKGGYVCNSDVLETNGCLVHVTGSSAARYKTACAANCSRSDSCVGYLWAAGVMCYLHTTPCCETVAQSSAPCSTSALQVLYFHRQTPFRLCGGDGVWDSGNQKCVCSGGLVGNWCERYAVSCRELADWGYSNGGRHLYYLQPQGFMSPSLTMCALTAREARTFVSINKGNNLFFNRTWKEYVDGFNNFSDGPDEEDLWLGLELLHHYTVTDGINSVRVLLDLSGGPVVYDYSEFFVRDKGENFSAHGVLDTLSIRNTRVTQTSTATPGADGCFTSAHNVFTPFSTPDHSSDVTGTVSCRSQSGAGWWFSSCFPYPVCNPLGQFYESSSEDMEMLHLHLPYIDVREMYDKTANVRVCLVESIP